ncbi:hypothetical protein Vadar_008327 [Vaccinium darrowii]|uniref:Uncharacterized protein n=1 Tax=Vaccinium darrowii TaxID=229202 RepID=A0ACB7YUS3_9ERIC|nr:hypothetical protein Vadar_008327 [Vaccinium darrowii]
MTTFFKSVEYFTDKSRTTLAKMNDGHVYSSFATNKYEHWRQKARRHQVVQFDGTTSTYIVQTPVNPTSPYKGNHLHVIKFNERTCTCNKLQQWKMPCSQVIAVCTYHNLDPLYYFNDYWKLESSSAIYRTLPFQPVYDEDYWPPYFGDTILPDKDRVRGKGAFIQPSSLFPVTSDEEMEMYSKGKPIKMEDSGSMGSGKRKSFNGGGSSCKKERLEAKQEAYEQFAYANQMRGDYYVKMGNKQEDNNPYSIANVLPFLKEIKHMVDKSKYLKAYNILVSEQCQREGFMNIDSEMRADWANML